MPMNANMSLCLPGHIKSPHIEANNSIVAPSSAKSKANETITIRIDAIDITGTRYLLYMEQTAHSMMQNAIPPTDVTTKSKVDDDDLVVKARIAKQTMRIPRPCLSND